MSDLPEWMQRLQSQASRTAASSGTPGPYRPGYRPGAELPAYRAPRARPQGGSYAQERQFRMEGARDRFLRGGDLGAAGELALDMTGLPALAQAGRAFRAGDAQSGVTEGATGALQLAGTLSPLPNRGLFGRRLGGASMRNMTPPAEAAPQPQAMPRLLGRARDGSVLPMREPQPFRRTEARSEDLAAAAARPGQISAPAQQFDDGAMRALRRALREDGLEIPNPLPEFPRRRLGLGDLQRNQIGGLDRADAARYARMSGTAPPIMVRNLGRGRYYVLDGNRRALAAELRGDREIDAVDVSGVFDPSPAIPMVGGTPEARQRAIEQGFDVTLSPLPNRGLFGRRLNGAPVRTAPPADRVASEFADAAKRRIPLAERGFAGVQPAEESTLEDWWRLVDQSQPERATLGLSDLTATQDSVSDNFAAVAAANQGRRPVVIEEGGRRYIIDGHHRALAAPDGRLDVDLYRSNWTPPGEAAPQPQAMPRLLGRASDGSVLPMREPQPFRRTAATSADLVEAARPQGGERLNGLITDDPLGNFQNFDVRPSVNDPVAMRMERARRMGFDVDTPLYVSSLEDLRQFAPQGRFYGNSGLGGIHLTDNPEMASRYLDRFGSLRYDGTEFQKNVMPVFIRPGTTREIAGRVYDGPQAVQGFPLPEGYSWPRNLDGVDTVIRRDAISSTGDVQHSSAEDLALLRELSDDPTYHGPAIEGREFILRDPSRVRSIFAAFDPARSNSSDLLASWGGLAALPAGAEVARRRAQQK